MSQKEEGKDRLGQTPPPSTEKLLCFHMCLEKSEDQRKCVYLQARQTEKCHHKTEGEG